MEDLNMAIVLSKAEGKSACQAFTQRAIIKRLEGMSAWAPDWGDEKSNTKLSAFI